MRSSFSFLVGVLCLLGAIRCPGQTTDHFNISFGQTVTNGVPGPGAGNIESAGSTDVYTFNASPGQVVYFDEQSGDSCASARLSWRCTGPTSGVLFDEQLAASGFCGTHEPGTITLTNGGTYTITVYGQGTATGTYQFTVWAVTNQVFNVSIGQTVSNGVPANGAGNIESPGVEDRYTFTASPGQVVYFDEQSGDSCSIHPLFWRCTDSTGAVLFDQQLAAFGFCGTAEPGTLTLTNGGTYTITVYGQTDATGTYQFTVWPVASQAFSYSIGQTVSNGIPAVGAGNIESPGTQDRYAFTATPGLVVYFDELSGDSCSIHPLFWRCTDSTGAVLFDQQLAAFGFCGTAEPGILTLTNGGTYTITVYGQTDATGTYEFTVSPVANQTFSYSIGQTVSNGVPTVGAGNIESPGTQDRYTFTATPGQVVYFDELSGDACSVHPLYWRCTDSTGAVLFDQQLAAFGFCGTAEPGILTLTNGGTYTIAVYGQTDATGTYEFAVWPVANQTFSYGIGQTVSNGVPAVGAGNIESPGTQDRYTFTATQGQVVYFDELSGDSCSVHPLYWRCTDSTGAVLFDQQLAAFGFCNTAEPGILTLTNGGTYTITVYGQTDATGTYEFTVWPVAHQTFSYGIGQTVSNGVPTLGAGNIESPGTQDRYTFTAARGQVVYFDEQSGDACSSHPLFWRCTDSTGAVLFDQQLAAFGFCNTAEPGILTLTNGGTYTIAVYGQTDATGTYQFTVWGVTNQQFNIAIGQPIAPGVPLSGAGNIETPGASDTYTFSATPGQVVYFDEQSRDSCGPQILWRCTDSTGALLFEEPIASVGFCAPHEPGLMTLTNVGSYTLTVYGLKDVTGTYQLTVWNVTNQFFSINIGDTVTNGVPAAGAGNIETPGVLDIYHFTANAGEKVYFNELSGDSCFTKLHWRCLDPQGGILFDDQIAVVGFCPLHDPGYLTLTNAGTYTLVASGEGDATGVYSFKVWKALPNIRVQPLGGNFPVGDTVLLSVVAESFTPLSYQWRFQGNVVPGATQAMLGLTNVLTTQAGQYDVLVSNNFGVVTSAMAVVTIYTNVPDLRVTDISPPAQAFAGQPVVISWGLTNQGNGAANGPWRDGVLVSRDPSGSNPVFVGSFLFTSNLAPGQSLTRTQSIVFPPSLSGTYYLLVQTDVSNQVAEAHGETNNTTVSRQPFQILPPDLTVSAVKVQTNAQFGQSVAITWTVSNIGTAPANSSWSDGLYLSRDTMPANGVLLLATNAPGPLPAGSNYTFTASVSLPLANSLTPGNYFAIAVADVNNTQPESNENNNFASAPITLTRPPLPDLTATNLLAPDIASPGDVVTLSWAVTNQGTATATGVWSETASLSLDGSVTNVQRLAAFTFTNTLPTGASIVRTQSVLLPFSSPSGSVRFAVVVNSAGDLTETDTNNNITIATNSTLIPATLTLQLPAQLNESDSATIGTVTRNGDTSAPLTVSLSNSSPAHLFIQTNVVIAAGHNSASFSIQPLPDNIVEGPQSITITATAAGFGAGRATLALNDSDVPALVLKVNSPVVPEGGTITATIIRQLITTNDLTVFPHSSSLNHLVVPTSVTILASQASTTFPLEAIDDGLVSTGRTVAVSASAAGYTDATPTNIFVADADVPVVKLTLANSTVSEGAGPQATTATVTRTPVSSKPVTLMLVSSNTAAALVPATVTIPAGQGAATFPVAAVNDNIVGNTRQTLLTPIILDATFGVPVTDGGAALLTVLDDDGPVLKLAVDRELVSTGLNPATTATISRSANTNQDLVVSLTSSDPTHATVPQTVTIGAGQFSSTFSIASTSSGTPGVNYPITITGNAPGFTPGSDTLVVANVNLPDLTVTSITAPASAQTETYANISYRVVNQGQAPSGTDFLTQVFLTRDPGNLTNPPVSQYTFKGALPTGQFFGQTVQVLLPVSAGDYWIVVSTDSGNQVAETLENNNTIVSAAPIHVQAAYEATVTVDAHTAPAGTAVPLHGRAFRTGTTDFMPQVPVNIFIWVRGTQRILSAQTDNSGNFTTAFLPLPNEGGSYQIGAANPGDLTAPIQDAFTLVGMRSYPASPPVAIFEHTSITGAVAVANLSELPLTALTVNVASQMGNVTGIATFTTNALAGLGTNTLTYVLRASDATIAQGTVRLHLTSAQGATLDVPLQVSVQALQARVLAVPGNLLAGMKRGDQTMVEFDLVNLGGAPTAPLQLLVPNLPWLHVASVNPIPSLAPGATNHVTLQLTPASDLGVGDYTGSLIVGGGDVNLPISFDFRALSEAKGDLRVTAVDEYTYYAAGSPPVAGAAVTIRDPVSGIVLTNGVTDSRGIFYAAQLFEGFYTVDVAADKHIGFHGNTFLKAGLTNDLQTFLSRQTVQYIWTVTPTEIPEVFKIAIETTFETFVPIPVITVEPNLIDLSEINAEVTQIDLRISNHGLVAANDFHLEFGSNSRWRFTPLISDIGTLAAKTSVTVPLTIRRLNPLAHVVQKTATNGQRSPKEGGGGDCAIGARAIWTLFCGTIKSYSTAIAIANVGGDCGGAVYGTTGGSGAFGQPYVTGPVFVMPFDCSGTNNNPTNDCKVIELAYDAKDKLQPLLKGAETAVNAAITIDPAFRSAIQSIKLSIKSAKGGARTCCKPPGFELFGNITAGADVTIGPGFKESIDSGPLPIAGGELSLKGDVNFGVFVIPSINISGEVTSGCDGKPKACLTASLDFGIEAGPSGSLKAELKYNDQIAPTVGLADLKGNLTGGLHFVYNYCTDSNEVWCVTSDGITANLSATFGTNVVSPFGPTGSTNLVKGFTSCSPSALGLDMTELQTQLRELAHEAERKLLTSGHRERKDAEGICAQVRLRLDQDLVLTRSAFNATLELINNDSTSSLDNVAVQVSVLDANGKVANDRFGIQTNQLSGINATDGTGVVEPGTTGTASWLLIPTPDAAPEGPTTYSVGGFLSYHQGTNIVVVPFQPVPITVYPDPQLHVKYFHQRDVYADDPFTPLVEPSVPFSLAVMIQNTGKGDANNVKITSAQPKIIDNQKGLLIDFKIIGTEVVGQNRTPSLTVDFGPIDAGQIGIGRWLLTSTLQGLFVDYQATLEHTGGPSDKDLSIIDEVSIHEMIHLVQAPGAFEDGKPDFLVSDSPNPEGIPDRLYLSDGTTNDVRASLGGSVVGQLSSDNLSVQLTAEMPSGWTYLRVADPGQGQFDLVRVVRSDGVEIYFNTNVWTTDRTFTGQGKRPLYEHNIHLLDFNSTGSYQLFYATPHPVDSTAPTSLVAALPAQSFYEIPVSWSGLDTGGSGLAYFDVYVSDNNGPFLPWVTQTTDTGDTYFGTLGHTYAFYSVATDNSNNHEAPHATPDAQTTVSLVNNPPTLDPIADRTITQGDTLHLVATARDPDTNALTFSIVGNVPAGLQIDPSSGVLTWVTGGGTLPGTNRVTVQVLDNGLPREGMTRSFNVIVLAGNSPPALSSIANRTVIEGHLLTLAVNATDSDFPTQTLTFSLGSGAPSNATINVTNGIFRWQPTHFQIDTTNQISVVVTDNGTPSLSATQTFTVTVLRGLPDLVVAMGTTNLFIGQTSSVPVNVAASLDLTNVSFDLDVPVLRLTGLTLQPLVPQLASAVLQPAGSNRSLINLSTTSGQNLLGSRAVAALQFSSDTDPHSAIVPLVPLNINGVRADGSPITNVAGTAGRVFLVGREPLLDSSLTTNHLLSLTIYGQPGRGYALESLANFSASNSWTRVGAIVLSGASSAVTNLGTLSPAAYYRLVQTPVLSAQMVVPGSVNNTVRLLVAGEAGQIYELQESSDLVHWKSLATNTYGTNMLLFLDSPTTALPPHFYRVLGR